MAEPTRKEPLSEREVIEFYETGKHRRYGLMFAVNGGAFTVAKLIGEAGGAAAGAAELALGGLTLRALALGLAAFTVAMTVDIWSFGLRMRARDPGLFGRAGKLVLLAIGGLIAGGWILVARTPAP